MFENHHLTWSDWLTLYAAIVSTYAATVSTAVAIVHILRYRHDTRDRLILSLNFALPEKALTLKIVNASPFNVNIEEIYCLLRYEGLTARVQGLMVPIYPLDKSLEFPFRLDRNESTLVTFQLKSATERFMAQVGTDLNTLRPIIEVRELKTVRALVSDTKGNFFESKALKGPPEIWQSLLDG